MNPYDRFDLDPKDDVRTLTEKLRERMENARDPVLAAELRETWDLLTKRKGTRLELALLAAPETREWSPAQRAITARKRRSPKAEAGVTLMSLVPLPSLAAMLPSGAESPPMTRESNSLLATDPLIALWKKGAL